MKKSGNMFAKNMRYICLTGVIALGLMTIVGSNGGAGEGGTSSGGTSSGDGSTGGDSESERTYSIGGEVSDLSGTLVLDINEDESLTVTENGSFVFDSELPNGEEYTVSVIGKPDDYFCLVEGGTGTINGADFSDIEVNCFEEPSIVDFLVVENENGLSEVAGVLSGESGALVFFQRLYIYVPEHSTMGFVPGDPVLIEPEEKLITEIEEKIRISKVVAIDNNGVQNVFLFDYESFDDDEGNVSLGYHYPISSVDTELFGYVGEYDGHYYWVSKSQETWHDAKSACEDQGGHLITIGDSNENEIAKQIAVSASSNCWIGFTDEDSEGDWVWITGEEGTYTNWYSGEPNSSGNQDVAEIYTCGKWNDHNDYFLRYFIMEKEASLSRVTTVGLGVDDEPNIVDNPVVENIQIYRTMRAWDLCDSFRAGLICEAFDGVISYIQEVQDLAATAAVTAQKIKEALEEAKFYPDSLDFRVKNYIFKEAIECISEEGIVGCVKKIVNSFRSSIGKDEQVIGEDPSAHASTDSETVSQDHLYIVENSGNEVQQSQIAAFTASRLSGEAPFWATFEASTVNFNGHGLAHRWEYYTAADDEHGWQNPWVFGGSGFHAYLELRELGVYIVVLKVSHSRGLGVLGESQKTITVTSPPPSIPTNVSATSGDQEVTISWDSVSGATSYNIYWSTTSGVTVGTGIKISTFSSPYTHTGLANGTTYYYVVTAENSNGESDESSEVSATPSGDGGGSGDEDSGGYWDWCYDPIGEYYRCWIPD